MVAVCPNGFGVFHRQTHRRDLLGFNPTLQEISFSVGTEVLDIINDGVSILVNPIQVCMRDLFTVASEVYLHVSNVIIDMDG